MRTHGRISIWALLTAALLTVPAFADIIDVPRPAPEPEPTVLPVLAIAAAAIAAAVLVWTIIRRRRSK